MVKGARFAVAPALVACLRDGTLPTAGDIVHVARRIAGDLQGQAAGDPDLSLVLARIALYGHEHRA